MQDNDRGIQHVYKILGESEWRQAKTAGAFAGSALDLRDGFIHLSTAAQVRETAARHFASQRDLLLLTVDVDLCPQGALRWEPSRGGALFPHLYGELALSAVVRVDPLPLQNDVHTFPSAVVATRSD